MDKKLETHILKLSCKDQVGIVAKISSILAESNCNIVESKQFTDQKNGNFFIRQSFLLLNDEMLPNLKNNLEILAKKLNADFFLSGIECPMNTIMLVSKFDHCLNDLLYRKQTGELNIEVKTVASNHPDLEPLAKFHGAPYEVLPTGKSKLATKAAQEDRIRQLIDEQNVDLVILARYMQVLSDELCQDLAGRCINIHHSFLPSFKGARPYHQAFERGVKAIGATAHYVTTDLDEGPIIDQEVARVDHTFGPEQLLATGRNMENYALSRAVKAHSEHRVFLNGHKTVVLK